MMIKMIMKVTKMNDNNNDHDDDNNNHCIDKNNCNYILAFLFL